MKRPLHVGASRRGSRRWSRVRVGAATVLLGLRAGVAARCRVGAVADRPFCCDRPDLRGQPRSSRHAAVRRALRRGCRRALRDRRVLVSAASSLTGGVESLFTSLYVLPIVAASTVQFRRGGLQIAALRQHPASSASCVAQYLTRRHSPLPLGGRSLPPADVALDHRGLNVFGFFAVAFLGGSLAERARGRARSSRRPRRSPTSRPSTSTSSTTWSAAWRRRTRPNRVLTFNRSAV